ncbi:serine protease [Actinokineospora iranica]|uniref:Trypsin n=1 Tax=Actinokineospora iranica TaxID=1271860 RepID=A0A1G6VDI2_9PSEU|nr:serine protease [Actinokineospora iranica]SDD51077.1 Trypsin [Actinokineospora iranica]
MSILARVAAITALLFAALAPPAAHAAPWVVGGTPAPPGAYPWVVRLSMGCGGSLVSPQVVLTAAHCVRATGPDTEITATVGVVDLSDPTAKVVSSTYVHRAPEFIDVTQGNDWALIKLATPVEQSVLELEPAVIETGEFAIMGWGADKEGGSQQQVLLHAKVPMVGDQACADRYKVAGYPFMPAGMVCAGLLDTGGVDTCQGDSGGPMVLADAAGVLKQVGIVSWGIGCARPQYPGIYTEVATYDSSIKAAITSLP